MVAVVSGNGLGLFNTSLTQLGMTLGGQAGIGQSRESQMVNIATGNLLLQDQDENLQVRGLSTTFLRTYNSRAQVSDAGQDGWITGFERHVALTGTLNTAGSTMTLYTGDGQAVVFTYTSSNHYTSTAGDGANDTLVWSSGSSTWTYTEGSTQRQETYANHADAVLKGRLTQIKDAVSGAIFNVLYDANNRVSEVRSVDDVNNATSDALLFGYDQTTGHLTSVTTREGGVVKSQLTYGYDNVGRLAWVQTDLTPTDAGDNTWDDATAANNDGTLFRTTYTYVTTNANDLRIASVTTSDGVSVSYTYASDGAGGYRVASVTQGSAADGSAQTVNFTYNSGSTDVTDASGRTWTYQYNANGQLTSVLEPAESGLRTSTNYTYDASGHVTQVKTMRGSAVLSQTDNAYDSNENLLSQWTRVDGASAAATEIVRTYDATTNQIKTETHYTGLDANGPGTGNATGTALTTTYVYDTTNVDRLLFVVDAAGGVSQYTYATSGNGVGQVASVRHFPGTAHTGGLTKALLTTWASSNIANSTLTTYIYDAKGRLRQTVDYASVDASGNGVLEAATGITNYTYDAQGLLLQKIMVHGSATDRANVLAGTAPSASSASEVTDYIYDGMGRLLSVLKRDVGTASNDDANTIATTYAYTDSTNLIAVTLDTGLIRTEARNAAGQLVSTSESGLVEGTQVTRTTQYYYDASGLLRATEDATGARSYLFYDNLGRLSAQVDATGAVTEFAYDYLNHLTQTTQYATGVDTSTWLSGGTVTVDTLVYAATEPTLTAGQAWVPTDVVNDRSSAQSFDALGRVATQTDASGLVTTYAYDGMSNLLSTTVSKPGDGTVTPRVTTYYYDSANRPAGMVDAAGYLTESVYDLNGRLIQTIRYATLAHAGTTLAARRPTASANDAISRFFYDGRGQLVGQLDDVGGTASAGNGYLTTYVYDEQANQRAVQAYGTLLTGLTGSETLASLQASATGGSGGMRLTQRSYNGLGQLTTELNPEGTVTRYSYDEAGRLVRTEADQGQSDVRESFDRYDVFGNLIGTLSGEQAAQATATLSGGLLLNDPSLTDAQLDTVYSQFGTTYNYDLLGRRIESIDAQGNKTWAFYDADDRQTFAVRGVTDGNGIQNAQGEVTETRYNAFGQVIDQLAYTGRITIPTPGSRASVLTAIGSLSFVAATDTQRLSTYDVRGLLNQTVDAEGVVSNYSYTAFGQLLQEQRAVGTTAEVTIGHVYDQRGLETSRTDGIGTAIARTMSQTYDAFGRVATQTDALGTVTTYSYDRMGRQLSRSEQVTAEGTLRTEAWLATYDAYDRILTQTDALGSSTTYAYDDANRSVTVTSAEGVVMSTVHNAFGQTVQVTSAAGTTSYDYDRNGALLQTTDADGGISSNTYDVRGLLAETTDASGRTVSYTYDAAGRVLARIVDPDGLALTATWSYDGQGRAVQTVDASGQVTNTSYDREGRVLSVAVDPDGLNLLTTYTWDAAGRELTVTEGSGSSNPLTTVYTYDALGRRTSESVDPGALNLTTTYGYDANDNLIARTDPYGLVTYLSYDEANRLRFTVDPAGDVSETKYDADGRVAETLSYAKAATGISEQQSVAQMRSLISSQALSDDAVDPVAYRVYDTDGRLCFTIDGLGDVGAALYDSAGRTVGTRSYANAITLTGTLKTQLDNGTAQVADITTALTADDSRDAQTYQVLDAAGRARFAIDGLGNVTEMRYDAAGRVIEQLGYVTPLTLSGADRIALEDGAMTVATIAGRVAAQETSAHASYVIYDAAGRARYTVTHSQVGVSVVGSVAENRYDAVGRIVEQIRYAVTVAFDPGQTEAAMASLLTAAGGNLPMNEHATRFVYDAAGRQRFTVSDAGTVSEQRYDAAGRVVMTRQYGTAVPVQDYTETMLAAAVAGFSDTRQVTYAYDTAGRLASTTDALDQTESYGYDADSRRTSLTNKLGYTWTYVYDAAGRQTEIHTPQVAVLRFDASGNLLSPSTESVVTKIAYDGLDNVVSRIEAYGTTEARTTTYAYDARGNQILTTFPDAWNVNASGVLVATGVTPTIQVTYDVLDRAVVQQDVRGNDSYKVYDLQGRLAYDIDADGYVTGYGYDAQGEVVTLTRYATKLNFAGISGWSAGHAISLSQIHTTGVLVASASDRTITTIYDVAGNKRSVTQTAVTYTKADGTTATGSPTTVFELDAYGQVVKESVLLEGTPGQSNAVWADTYHYYDDLGRKVMDVDAEGYVTACSYTAQGEILQQIQYARALSAGTLAALTTATPPAAPAPGDATIGYDRITQYTYDALGRKASQTDVGMHYERTDGSSGVRDIVTTLTYDAVDEVLQTTVDGVATQTTYDALGRTVSVEEAQRAVLAANADAQLSGASSATTSLTTAALYVQSSPYTTIGYDAFGNTVQVRRYANGWVDGQSAAVTSSSDQVQTTEYDHQGRAAIVRDAQGNTVYNHYDAADNLVEVDQRLDGNNGRWSNVRALASYDAVNQQTLTQVFRDTYLNSTALGTKTDQVVQVKYNAFGEISSKGDSSDPNATLAAQYSYDNVGRMTSTNAQGGVVRTYGYNLAGFQVTESHTMTVASGNVTATTTQANDKLGRVVQVTLPSYTNSLSVTSTVLQTLDRWGNVIEMIDPRGYVTDTAYNQRDQKVSETQPLVKVVDAAGVETWKRPEMHWFYDALGRLQGTRDANGNVSKLVYDATGRQVQSIDGVGNATLVAYNALGQQRLSQNAMGYITFQEFDNNGRVVAQGDYLPDGAARNKTVLQDYTLNQNGDRIATTDALGDTNTADYDSRSLLLRSQSAAGQVMNYAYDASGHKTLEEDGDSSHIGVQTWATDFFGRTTAHSDLSSGTYSYTYDASSGQLVHETSTNGLNRTTVYYANGQVRQITETGGPTSYYEYDAAGNRTVEETTSTDSEGLALHVRTTTTYDSHNRIAHTVQDDLATGVRVFDLTYDYDAQGNRRHVVATTGYGTDTAPIATDNLAPVVVGVPDDRTLRAGVPVSFRIRATDVFRDPELDVLSLDVKQLVGGVPQSLPSWLSCTLDTSTGELVFTASAGSSAALGQTLTIQIAATDTSSNTTTTSFTLAVVSNSTPVSSGAGTSTFLAKTDEAWAIEVPASTYFSDPDVGDTLSLTVTGISPAASWLTTVDTSNPSVVRLAGMPSVADEGIYSITIRATDAQGATVTRTLTVTVAPNHAPVVVTSIAAQDATISRTFELERNLSDVFTDADGDPLAISATLANGSALPAWLTFQYLNDQAIPQLQLTGLVPGTETPGTVYQVKLTATDSDGATVSTTVAITIQPNRAPVVVGSLPVQSGRIDTAFVLDIPIDSLFVDPDGDPMAFSLLASSSTSWVTLTTDTDNGVLHLTGTPNVAGDYSLRIIASDQDGLATPYDISLHVRDNTDPTFNGYQPTTTLYTNQKFNFTIPKATDADGDPLSYDVYLWVGEYDPETHTTFYHGDPLPSWLNFDSATGTFSGTAPSSAVSTMTIKVRFSLSNGYTFSLSVSSGTPPANHAPTATGTLPAIVRATPNQAFSYKIPDDAFADADYDAPVFAAPTGTLPPGITFSTATGTFSGTPTTSGSWTVTLHVSDGRGGSVSPNPTLTIEVSANHAPTVAHATADKVATQGQAWTGATLASNIFSDSDGDALSWVVTGLPPGVVYTPSTRSFSGTPLVAGTFNVSVTATDSSGASVSDVFVLTVAQAPDQAPVVANPIADQSVGSGLAWDYTFASNTFSDPDGDTLTYTVSGMPAGLSFSAATRTFSGTPSANGTSTITVTADDGRGHTVSDSFTLTVGIADQPPVVAHPLVDQSGTTYEAFTYVFASNSFTDPDGDTLTYTATGVPSGISFNATTRTFSGTPAAAGTSTITVTANDGHGGTVSDSFTLTVVANHAPVAATPIPAQTATQNEPFDYAIPSNAFTDADGDSLTYSMTGNPGWLHLGLNGQFSGHGTSSSNSSWTITVTASDGHGGTAQSTLYLQYFGNGGHNPLMVQQFTMSSSMQQEETEQGTTVVQQDAWYAYDADNRVVVSNGVLVDGQIVIDSSLYTQSRTLIYDAAGHKIAQEEWGGSSDLTINQTVVDLRGETVAIFTPHALSQSGSIVTRQEFDDAGRLVQTVNYYAAGTILQYPDGDGDLIPVRVGGMLLSVQQYIYDADGRIKTQTELARPIAESANNYQGHPKAFPTWLLTVGESHDEYTDFAVLETHSIVNYVGSGLGYDAAGRLKGYTYYSVGGDGLPASTQTFIESYLGRDSWLESSVAGSSTNPDDHPTTSTIAYDAAGRQQSITEHTEYGSIDDRLRVFAYDADGQILSRRDGLVHSGNFYQGANTYDDYTNGDINADSVAESNHHEVYVNGQQVASLDEYGNIDALSRVTGFDNTDMGSSNVVVQAGESLQAIAQRVYGDAGLWYVLAAANALDVAGDSTLVAGVTLKAPQVTTNSNDASTFKPYNPSEITGPTSPTLPHIPPPDAGCGTIGMVIMIIVMIIVTIYTAGAAAGAMGSAASTTATATAASTTAAAATSTAAATAEAAGASVAAATAGATFSTGLAVLGGTYGATAALVAGAIGGFVGSVAGQAVGSAMGVAHFSWQSAVVSGVVGGATAGFGALAKAGELGPLLKSTTWARAGASAVVGNLTTYAADKALGIDTSFSWKSVAASAVTAAISTKLGDVLGFNPTTDAGGSGDFWHDVGNGLISGVVGLHVRRAFGFDDPVNYGNIATDAFGNAIANAIIRAATAYVDPKAQQQKAWANPQLQSQISLFGPQPLPPWSTAPWDFGFGVSEDAYSQLPFGGGTVPGSGSDTVTDGSLGVGLGAGNGFGLFPALGTLALGIGAPDLRARDDGYVPLVPPTDTVDPATAPGIDQDVLNRAQYRLDHHDRAGAYLELYMATGNPQLLFVAQITTFTGSPGGAAVEGNFLAKLEDPDKYVITLDEFSKEIVQATINLYKSSYEKNETVTPLQIMETDRGVWKSYGLEDYFPGNLQLAMTTGDSSLFNTPGARNGAQSFLEGDKFGKVPAEYVGNSNYTIVDGTRFETVYNNSSGNIEAFYDKTPQPFMGTSLQRVMVGAVQNPDTAPSEFIHQVRQSAFEFLQANYPTIPLTINQTWLGGAPLHSPNVFPGPNGLFESGTYFDSNSSRWMEYTNNSVLSITWPAPSPLQTTYSYLKQNYIGLRLQRSIPAFPTVFGHN